MKTRTIEVKGMSCNHCVASVTKALSALDGVTDVKVDLTFGTATYTETKDGLDAAVKSAIDNAGFTPGGYR
ncbi:Copper chaperone CopZ [Fundidesulfovibrio magnetotacticus]|uniref:Copper chaperone CopZ n=1 Tax=Fundidesulfovibrio magnetotacticus TaxID=2730080 RepID=A0A6V8LVC5_9BACT|nr:cation transporter [Fundidesulfovibrio magnetotacticus]GFK94258.1 Copper chaperone CopZ [Fundidesulfovibrio magnetotacticus]